MALVDFEKIINGTPQKRFLNAYDTMKENYNETSAKNFFESYSNETLSFLFENSRLIFSEPYFGYHFYKESVENIANCGFNYLEDEKEKVKSYLEDNKEKMSKDQVILYESLLNTFNDILDKTKATRVYASYIKENIDDRFEEKLSNAMFEYHKNSEKDLTTIMELFNENDNSIVYFTYVPYVAEDTHAYELLNQSVDFMKESALTESCDTETWTHFVENVVCLNKLKTDSAYMEAVSHTTNRSTKIIFEYFMNQNLNSVIDDLMTEAPENIYIYKDASLAVNDLFNDMRGTSLFDEENHDVKDRIMQFKGIAYEETLNVLVHDYQTVNDTNDSANGYSLLNESCTVEEAFNKISSLYNDASEYFLEGTEEDDLDLDTELEDNSEDKSNNKEVGTDGKKPLAPQPKKSIFNKVQFKMMDREAKKASKKAEKQAKGQEKKGMIKSILNVPAGVVNTIKSWSKSFDEADERRRKEYMKKPGWRKKVFRNLKLAILYTGGAMGNIALVPVIALCRHFSKDKDRRIRNELIREIETEIKVCDEKINDAQSDGSKSEKYKLIRIKEQLEAELVRVKSNSKYI